VCLLFFCLYAYYITIPFLTVSDCSRYTPPKDHHNARKYYQGKKCPHIQTWFKDREIVVGGSGGEEGAERRRGICRERRRRERERGQGHACGGAVVTSRRRRRRRRARVVEGG
jgi:hypothetical protein